MSVIKRIYIYTKNFCRLESECYDWWPINPRSYDQLFRKRARKINDRCWSSVAVPVVYLVMSVAIQRPRGSDFKRERVRKRNPDFFLLEIWAISDTFFQGQLHHCSTLYIILSVSGVYIIDVYIILYISWCAFAVCTEGCCDCNGIYIRRRVVGKKSSTDLRRRRSVAVICRLTVGKFSLESV